MSSGAEGDEGDVSVVRSTLLPASRYFDETSIMRADNMVSELLRASIARLVSRVTKARSQKSTCISDLYSNQDNILSNT